MRRLREQFPNELVVISVHSGKFPTEKLTANIRQAVMRHGIDRPVVNDVEFEIWQSYTVRAWPTLVLIDHRGKVVHTQSGEILAEEFSPLIEGLVDKAEDDGQLDRMSLELRPEAEFEPERPLIYPAKLLLAPGGRLYLADTGHHRILELRLSADGLSGEIERVFGSGQAGFQDGPASEAMFHDPRGMALKERTLYVADTENHAVRAIDLDSGKVRTVAGTGEKAHGRFNLGAPTDTPLRSPWALLAEDDVIFVAMAGSHQIWAILDEEQIGPFAGNGREALVDGSQIEASFNQPSDLALGMGHMFVADAEASAIRAISLNEEKPQVVTLIGQGLFEFGDVDGMGGMVRLQHPSGLTFADGLVYIADSYNHKIKTLDPTTGQVKTLIGTGQPGEADGPFAEAELFEPEGVIAGEGRLYITDTNNHLIRVANLADQTVQTLRLQGLERLHTEARAERPVDRRLEPVTVATGSVRLTFDLDLPTGYKLNPEAPLMVQLWQNGSARTYRFESDESPTLTVEVAGDQALILDLMLYYCQAAEERLCLLHDARLLLPLTAIPDGTPEALVPYRLPTT